MDDAPRELDPDKLHRLVRAIEKLRPVLREPFILSAVEKLDYFEIAERLGTTVLKVERRISRALCALDRELCRQREPWWRR